MKVIVAAFPKCGTKTMAAALKQLNFLVYDAMENFEFLEKEWIEVFTKGANIEHFKKMFENVDACTDIPACYFWYEIHQAFPDAKVCFIFVNSFSLTFKVTIYHFRLLVCISNIFTILHILFNYVCNYSPSYIMRMSRE